MATNGDGLQLNETTSYGFAVPSYSGSRINRKAIFNCHQALAHLVFTDLKYESLDYHGIFNFRAWNALIVAWMHGLLKTIQELVNCFVGLLPHLLETVMGCEYVILGLPQFCQLPQGIFRKAFFLHSSIDGLRETTRNRPPVNKKESFWLQPL